jgi:hypothetical protein
MLLSFGSVKGSPGVTTFALAMAARWPHPGPAPVVVELDGAGGDVGSRWDTYDEPGLASLASGSKGGPIGDGAEFVQRLRAGVDVVIAPPSDAAAATLEELGVKGPGVLREVAGTRPVFADLGRLDPQSPMLAYLDKADELLLVARPVPEEMRHLRMRVPILRQRCPVVRVVLVGNGPHRPEEVAAYLQLEVATVVPHDPLAADILAGRKRPRRWGQPDARREAGWTRQPLLAAARSFAFTYETTPAPAQESEPSAGRQTATHAPAPLKVTP